MSETVTFTLIVLMVISTALGIAALDIYANKMVREDINKCIKLGYDPVQCKGVMKP